jgi:hypothetical protein
MAAETTEDFLLIVWVILGFIALGAVMAWAMLRNRGIERKRERVEYRHVEKNVPPEAGYRR